MKRYSFALVLVLVAIVPAFVWAGAITDSQPGMISLGLNGGPNMICAFGDSIWGFDCQTAANETQCLGVEFDGTNFYVTGGGSGADPNKVHIFDSAGNYISTFDQFRATAWGWRDLAWDGTHLYGSDDQMITEFGTDGTDFGDFTGPLNPNRALAYDPATDHFWTANFASNIYEFDRSGTVIGNWTNAYSIYGMAWDAASPDGPWLWVFSQDGTPPATVWQYDPIGHNYTGLSFVAAACSMAGGATFITDWDPGFGILFCLGQATPDRVIGYEIVSLATRDVGPFSIDSPGPLVMPGSTVPPCATVKNFADSTETFYVYFLVDSAGTNVYLDSTLVTGLMPDSVTQVCFQNWTADGQGNVYDLTCITALGPDQRLVNDTLRATTMAFAVDSIIFSGWAYGAPVMDGTIDPIEWGSATVEDISDVLGIGSPGVTPNSVLMYVMNNTTHIYFAIDYTVDATDNVNDRTVVYLDEGNDNAWTPDSTEGYYSAFKSSNGPRMTFKSLPTGPFTSPVPGAEIAMGFVSHVTYEFSLPLGVAKYEVNAQPDDTLGMHIYAHDQGNGENEGWWLQTLEAANLEVPVYYGHLVLHTVEGVEEGARTASTTTFGILGAKPNPFAGRTAVTFVGEGTSRVSLKVHDLAGRVVRSLFDGIAAPGENVVSWDGKDAAGRELPSGTYFYRLSSEGRCSSTKTVLLR